MYSGILKLRLFSTHKYWRCRLWWYWVKLCETNHSRPQLLKLSTQHSASHRDTYYQRTVKEETCAGILYTQHYYVMREANIESTKLDWIFNLLIQWWRDDQIRECDIPGAINVVSYLVCSEVKVWFTTAATPSNTVFSLVEPGHTLFSAFCV